MEYVVAYVLCAVDVLFVAKINMSTPYLDETLDFLHFLKMDEIGRRTRLQ